MRHTLVNQVATLQSSAGIVVLEELTVATLQQLSSQQRKVFFEQFRLNLQSRLVGMTDVIDIYKLQGKLEYISELEQLFGELGG